MTARRVGDSLARDHARDLLDTRLAVYASNCARVPSVSGAVIPEPVFTPAAYANEILARIAGDMAPLDLDGVLEAEWVMRLPLIVR